jgi:hypothetical protein
MPTRHRYMCTTNRAYAPSVRGRWRFAIVVSLLVVILVSSCNAPGDNQPSPPPQLPSITGAVTLTPDQVILPDEQFPLAGYSVATDNAVGTDSWTRMWAGTGAYWWVRVDVTVLGPSASSSDAIAKTVCDWTFTPPMLGAAEVAAPVVGDGAKACGYDSATAAASTMVYTTGTRNVLVTVGANRRTTTSTSAAANFISSLADYQLWIIDKVAPLPGVALRPTPQVQVPAVAVVVTPQPTLRPTPGPGGPTPVPGTPTPATPAAMKVNVNPSTVDFGAHGGCDGGSILQQRFDVTASSDVSWTVDWAGSSFVSWAHGSLDRTSGSGTGSVTWTVTLAPQTHSVSGFTCNDYYRYPYGDTISFTFSRNGAFLQRIDTHATYTYLALY